MCDLFSWGVPRPDDKDILDKFGTAVPDILFLTDEEASFMHDNPAEYPGVSVEGSSLIGHGAIAAYYRLSSSAFRHQESTKRIPVAMGAAVNSGKLDRIIRNSDNFEQHPEQFYRYTSGGNRVYGLCKDAYKYRTKLLKDFNDFIREKVKDLHVRDVDKYMLSPPEDLCLRFFFNVGRHLTYAGNDLYNLLKRRSKSPINDWNDMHRMLSDWKREFLQTVPVRH